MKCTSGLQPAGRPVSVVAVVMLASVSVATAAHSQSQTQIPSHGQSQAQTQGQVGSRQAPSRLAQKPAANATSAMPATGLVPAPAKEGSWPRTLNEAAGSDKPQPNWSAAEIEAERAHCRQVLHGVDAVVLPVEPFRHDGECGAPAAMQLISIGRNPEIAVSPPVIVTCDMVATLARWARNDLQVIARRHLGAPVIRIETMSSYACRNAYGRRGAKLSEHGRANAIDIRGFTTAFGLQTAVLDDWGMTQRAIEAKIAAARAEAARTAAAAAAAAAAKAKSGLASAPAPTTTGAVAGGLAAAAAQPSTRTPAPDDTVERPSFATIIEGLPGVGRRIPGLPRPSETGIGFGEPSRLGGPKPAQKAAIAVPRIPDARAKSLFHREVHATACKIFGTVLGPEANRAHENHFHFDMAERSLGNYCE